MAVREIVLYPESVLTTKAEPVPRVDDEIRALVDDMVETMYAAHGIGLAAPQIGVSLRIAVIDVAWRGEAEEGEALDEPDESDEPPRPAEEPQLHVLINPRIVERRDQITWDEGCLSMPGLYREVRRAGTVVVEALDRDGALRRYEASELLAVCMQHEIDHLDGVMFIDRLSALKRRLALKEWKRLRANLDEKRARATEAADTGSVPREA